MFFFTEIMGNLHHSYFVQVVFELNFYFFFCICIISILLVYTNSWFKYDLLFFNLNIFSFIRFILSAVILISFFINFFIFFLLLYENISYYNSLLNSNFLENFFYKTNFVSLSFFNYSLDIFGFIFLLLVYIVGFISLMVMDNRFYYNNISYIFLPVVIIAVVHVFVSTNDILIMFLFYEAMLLPSFLFVYSISSYRRGVQASLYFLIWTQLGSILVLIAISYIIFNCGGTNFFYLRNYNFNYDEAWYLYALLFFGFGFKVPIWPFHYWLTKTHVEAPAGFSIFLSGFLVKTAIYAFFKITNQFSINLDTSFFSIFVIMGIIDSSMKMWGQIDLKKLVAYGTVQEMNIIYLAFLWGDTSAYIGGIFFCITHAFLSSLMFFIVDCIQKRYGTRIISEITGILHTTPNLGLSIIFMQILYSGLPGTLKFLSEFYIFSGLICSAPLSTLFIIYIANFFGLIGFSKCWFNVVFGLTLNRQRFMNLDLTIKELLIISTCILCLIFITFFSNFIF